MNFIASTTLPPTPRPVAPSKNDPALFVRDNIVPIVKYRHIHNLHSLRSTPKYLNQ